MSSNWYNRKALYRREIGVYVEASGVTGTVRGGEGIGDWRECIEKNHHAQRFLV